MVDFDLGVQRSKGDTIGRLGRFPYTFSNSPKPSVKVVQEDSELESGFAPNCENFQNIPNAHPNLLQLSNIESQTNQGLLLIQNQ